MKATAIVIADSISDQGIRLTTFQLRYWRAIHSEVMTHRTFSRNAGSSRARPVKAIIEQVRTNPYGPIHWGENQAGMQASKEIDPSKISRAKFAWLMAAKAAADHAEGMMNMGLHKQVVNRILEPFTYIDVVVTATDYDNFFALRLHPDAQPEIQQLAQAMKEALDASAPKLLNHGEWHLPYIQDEERDLQDLDTLKKISAARCARVSYKTFDGNVSTWGQDIELYDKLMGGDIKHSSPTEHQATPDKYQVYKWDCPQYHGNFTGWIQYRKTLYGENACKIHILTPADFPDAIPSIPDRRSMYQYYYDMHKDKANPALANLWPLFLDHLVENLVNTHLSPEQLVLMYLDEISIATSEGRAKEDWERFCQVNAYIYNDEYALLM